MCWWGGVKVICHWNVNDICVVRSILLVTINWKFYCVDFFLTVYRILTGVQRTQILSCIYGCQIELSQRPNWSTALTGRYTPKNMYLNRRLSNLASSLISGTFTLESRKLEGKLHQSPCRQNGELFWGVGTSKVICRFRIWLISTFNPLKPMG